MHRTLRPKRDNADRGFTLIELLVVVVIIGVLVAIAIPLYLNYRKGAENKSATADLRGAIATIEQCYADSASVYPTAIDSAGSTLTGCTTSGAAIRVSPSNTLTYYPSTASAPTNYMVWTTHGTNGVYYCFSSAKGGSPKSETTAPSAYAAACP